MRLGQPKKYSELYNKDIKNEYINSLKTVGTRKSYFSRLGAIGEYEFLWEKDLYDFNIDEIQLFLHEKGGTVGAIRNWGSVIASYLKWANGKGYKNISSELLNRLNNEFYDSFANPFFFTKKGIDNLVEHHCENLEEKLIILLLFEGLTTEEIIHLKFSDIKSHQIYIQYYDRTMFDVSNELIELLFQFREQPGYDNAYVKNRYIPNQEYFLKKVNTNINENETTDDSKIYRILKKIGQKVKEKLSPITLNRSGMLYYAMLLYKESGKMEKKEYDEIIKRFNIKPFLNNGRPTPPYYHLRTVDLINEDSIKLYYLDIHLEENQIQSNPLWKIKEQNGLSGEKVVWRYLENEYPKCHLFKPADKEGYDIEVYKTGRIKSDKVIIKKVEVKTVQKNGRTIYLTSNELEKAKAFGDEYYIYLVNNVIEQYEIYIIQNPISYFNINLEELENVKETSFCSINVSSIKLRLKEEFFETHNPIIVPKTT